MRPVIAYHVVFCTHGFWLPNDPRGSFSDEVRFVPIRQFGPATKVNTRRSVAGHKHDANARRAAKDGMRWPEVRLTGLQASSVGTGFANQVETSGYQIFACAIMPDHLHLVIGRHHYSIEQVGRLLKQSATSKLLNDGRHPFASADGKPQASVWAQDFWKVFLFDAREVWQRINYVNQNPIKAGLPAQRWSFVVPFSDASMRR